MRGTCGNARGEYGDLLRAFGKGSDDVDAFHRFQFADLLKANFKFSGGNDSSDGIGFNLLALVFNLVGDSKLRK